jgi:hypothetical protein
MASHKALGEPALAVERARRRGRGGGVASGVEMQMVM